MSRSIIGFLLGLSLAASCAHAREIIGNAFEAKIEKSPIRLTIAPFLKAPLTSEKIPQARINMLKPIGDGSGRLGLCDLRGPLYFVQGDTTELYLDLSKEIENFIDKGGLGVGLGSFAFHPDFAKNGLFYTIHNEKWKIQVPDFPSAEPINGKPGVQAVLLEWKAEDPQAMVFKGERRELMRWEFPGGGHGVQEIAFNPLASTGDEDYGNLYICVGEGGTRKHGYVKLARNLDTVLGKILRINPLGRDSKNGRYGIVPSNPWASDENPETLGEIWVIGIRNPHRLCWDREGDGKMLFTDIGEFNIEEVNLAESGRDYGWNFREGTFRFDPSGERFKIFDLEAGEDEQSGHDYSYPVAQYDHSEGMAISGGQIYRGRAIPELQGTYLFGDMVLGRLFAVDADSLEQGKQSVITEVSIELDGVATTLRSLVNENRVDLRIGYDSDGELFLMEKTYGNIYRIVSSKTEPVAAN